MSITDELRGFANSGMSAMECSAYSDKLIAIADRIDAEHERAMADAYLSGTPTDEKLTELGWIRLPKDADGEYIHMGDRMENGELVARIVLTDGSWEPTVYTASTPNQLHEYYCHDIGHYHAPTVEDVLREFTHAILNQKACYREQNIAEYASKLRLAEGEDE